MQSFILFLNEGSVLEKRALRQLPPLSQSKDKEVKHLLWVLGGMTALFCEKVSRSL